MGNDIKGGGRAEGLRLTPLNTKCNIGQSNEITA